MSDDPIARLYGQGASVPQPEPDPGTGTFQGFEQLPQTPSIRRFDDINAAKGQTQAAFAGIGPKVRIPIFDVSTALCRGMFSALAPGALHPGQFSLIQDLRFDTAALQARYPTVSHSTTGLPSYHTNSGYPNTSGPGRGIWSGQLNGTTYVIQAVYDGTKVGIYFSTDGLTYTTGTATSGAYGDTRMTDTGLPFSFAAANNPNDGNDYLLIQNGTDQPRVFSTASANSVHVWPINQYSAPAWAETTPVYGRLRSLVNLSTITGITSEESYGGASQTDFVVSQAGSGSDTYWTLLVKDTVAAGYVTYCQVSNFDLNTQVVIASDNYASSLWSQIAIDVSTNGTTWVPLYGTGGTYAAPVENLWTDPAFPGSAGTTGGLGGEDLLAYNCAQLAQISPGTTYSYIAFRYVGTPPANGTTFNIHLIAGGGDFEAFQNVFALSYAGLNQIDESPGVQMPGTTATNQNCGALDGTATVAPTVLYAQGIYYDYTFDVCSPNATDLANFCDTINLYRSDFNGTVFEDYFYAGHWRMGGWESGAGAWWNQEPSLPPLISTAPLTSPVTYPTGTGSYLAAPDPSRYAPDTYNTTVPVASAMTDAVSRTFIGNVGSYAFSEYGQPFRFRPALLVVNGAPVARSAATVKLSGQTVYSFATPSGSALNSQMVFFWTQVRTYALGGFDGYSLSQPACQSEVGISAPNSIVQYKDSIYFLDDNQEVRDFKYGRANLYGYQAYAYDLMPAISKLRVDDQTKAIPVGRLPWVCGVGTFDRYYLWYSRPGQTANLQALVFDVTVGAWVQDSVTAGAECSDSAILAIGKRQVFQGSDGGTWFHEDPLSTAVHTCRLTGPEISMGMFDPVFFGRIGIVMDVQPGQYMAIVRTVSNTGQTQASSVDLHTAPANAPGMSRVWRYDSFGEFPTSQPGVSGLSCQIAMEWTMTPGTNLYTVNIETSKAQAGADQL
jgi:hypothetical protein